LDREAPEFLEVPSGSRIRLDYENDPPKLSVRLQEVFGWLETPRIGKGRVPVLMELLSPGFKPIQVTRDLRSFWSTAYFEVKKELKARYPKHSWPEDPLVAKPVAKGRRTGSS
jgi:ATP-dependent helicase HrpB